MKTDTPKHQSSKRSGAQARKAHIVKLTAKVDLLGQQLGTLMFRLQKMEEMNQRLLSSWMLASAVEHELSKGE